MKKAGILGATGMIGAHYMQFLKHHPWFKVHACSASEKSQGNHFEGFALRSPKELTDCDVIFSALPSSFSAEYETYYAKMGQIVFSSSSFFRKDSDIPLIIPEINKDHLNILPCQRKKRDWPGAIVAKPNCSIQSFLLPLAALHPFFPIEQIQVATMQAVSGAGNQGLSSFSILDNVIPFIESEEDKSETEPLKILGKIEGSEIRSNSSIKISAHCNRVPVLHGHMACVSVQFKKKPAKEEILNIWAKESSLSLPSAPKYPIHYLEDLDRPQPRLDRDQEKGMAITVGRLRPCPIFDWRFVALSHNAVRGGAGGGVLSAELLLQEGWLG